MVIRRARSATVTIILAAAAANLTGPAPALADVAPCPTAPAAFTVSDPPDVNDTIVSELRELRRENVQICELQRAAAVEIRDATLGGFAQTITALDTLDISVAAGNTAIELATRETSADQVDAINATPAPSGSDNNPTVVSLKNSENIQEQLLRGYSAMREVLWVMVGLMLVSLVAPMIRRLLWP